MRNVNEVGLDQFRIAKGPLASTPEQGNDGAFLLHSTPGTQLVVIASDGAAWDHVSVHAKYRNRHGKTRRRTPTWAEMCLVKELFFDAEETVVQFHPPESEYVNNHPHCLHLWRSQQTAFPSPPAELVGIKQIGELTPA